MTTITLPREEKARPALGSCDACSSEQATVELSTGARLCADCIAKHRAFMAGHIANLVHAVGGRIEISATALLGMLNQRLPEEADNNPAWPQNPASMAMTVDRIREQLLQRGVFVQQVKRKGLPPGVRKRDLRFTPCAPGQIPDQVRNAAIDESVPPWWERCASGSRQTAPDASDPSGEPCARETLRK